MPSVIPLRFSEPATLPELCPATGPRPVRIDVGMQQLALAIVRNCFEDCMGRTVGVFSNFDRQRRRNAAHAIRFLRQAGRLNVRGKAIPADLRQEYVLSFDWCAEVLGVAARQLAWDGIHCVAGSGLRNWRTWRAQRAENKNQPAQRIARVCPQCGNEFSVKVWQRQKYCSATCARAVRYQDKQPTQQWKEQPAQQAALAPNVSQVRVRMGAPGYRGFADYCHLIGHTNHLTETQWRVLAG